MASDKQRIKDLVESKPKKMGRPKLELDEKLIYDLAMIHCTKEEIAVILGCCRDTLYANYSDVLRKGDEEGKKSLKRKMYEIAMKGNVHMLIWLAKQRLGHKDKQPDEVASTVINVQVSEIPK